MDPIERIVIDTDDYGDFEVSVFNDPMNPRGDGTFGHLLVLPDDHRRRFENLSDKNQPFYAVIDHGVSRGEFERWLSTGNVVAYPVSRLVGRGYGCDNFKINVDVAVDANTVDSECEAYMYVTVEEYMKEFNVRLPSDVLLVESTTKQAAKLFVAELETFNAYLNGEVYGYVVKHVQAGEVVYSCWGFIGGAEIDGKQMNAVDYCMYEAKGELEAHLKWRRREDERANQYMAL